MKLICLHAAWDMTVHGVLHNASSLHFTHHIYSLSCKDGNLKNKQTMKHQRYKLMGFDADAVLLGK
jgi:hypothetical protein